MKRKIFSFLLLIISILFLIGCSYNKEKDKINNLNKIKIVIVDENKKELYNKEFETSKKYLIDLLKDISEIKLKYDENNYGVYITSLMGVNEKTNDKKMYYWSYYINDNYAEIGVSNCEINNNTTYKFVYEIYEL